MLIVQIAHKIVILNEKDFSRCEMFCQSGNYGGFIPVDGSDADEILDFYWDDDCPIED